MSDVLEHARRQARALVDARLATPRPAFVVPPGVVPVLPIVVLLALAVSGAWAWTRPVAPRVLVSEPVSMPPVRRTPKPHVVVPPVVPAVAVPAKPLSPPLHVEPEEPIDPNAVDEPLGDVIEVKRPSKLPPLFDVSEYRSRGVMVE